MGGKVAVLDEKVTEKVVGLDGKMTELKTDVGKLSSAIDKILTAVEKQQ